MDDYFLKTTESKLSEISKNGKIYLSHFLTLEEQQVFIDYACHYPDLNLTFDGGIVDSEAKKVFISKKEFDIQPTFDIDILKIEYNMRYLTLTHRHVLGNLMSLGIERNRIGDIVLEEGKVYVAVSHEQTSNLLNSLKTMNGKPVEVSLYDGYVKAIDNGKEATIFVTSLRADNIISNCFNLSRSEVSDAFVAGMIKINQKIYYKAFYNCKENDIISVLHKGRIKILEAQSTTKSGRIVLKVKIYR